MSSELGRNITIKVFGQSHGEAIGVVMDGLPCGEAIDFDALQAFLDRRAPGRAEYATARREEDRPQFLSGITNGITNASPLCAIIYNKNQRSKDYDELALVARPGHADYTAFIKYEGKCDMRGGGQFSGRLTAPICIAGGIAIQMLKRRGITLGAHIASIGECNDQPFDPVLVAPELLESVKAKRFTVCSDKAGERMRQIIADAAAQGDSVGGVIECAVFGLPCGLGGPMFDGVEGALTYALFGIPAVKGVEFGSGFKGAQMKGSENNDPFVFNESGQVVTETNNHGGILGGITSGMPLILRAAFKPTPSISKAQRSVNLKTGDKVELEIKGRHDPCIVPRAVPVVEAVTALTMIDLLSISGKL